LGIRSKNYHLDIAIIELSADRPAVVFFIRNKTVKMVFVPPLSQKNPGFATVVLECRPFRRN